MGEGSEANQVGDISKQCWKRTDNVEILHVSSAAEHLLFNILQLSRYFIMIIDDLAFFTVPIKAWSTTLHNCLMIFLVTIEEQHCLARSPALLRLGSKSGISLTASGLTL